MKDDIVAKLQLLKITDFIADCAASRHESCD